MAAFPKQCHFRRECEPLWRAEGPGGYLWPARRFGDTILAHGQRGHYGFDAECRSDGGLCEPLFRVPDFDPLRRIFGERPYLPCGLDLREGPHDRHGLVQDATS